MFSRKNMMQPKQLDLRDVVGNMNKMLSRLLGENIALQFQSPEKLPPVQGDGGMIEQVVMNLSVNARGRHARWRKINHPSRSNDDWRGLSRKNIPMRAPEILCS